MSQLKAEAHNYGVLAELEHASADDVPRAVKNPNPALETELPGTRRQEAPRALPKVPPAPTAETQQHEARAEVSTSCLWLTVNPRWSRTPPRRPAGMARRAIARCSSRATRSARSPTKITSAVLRPGLPARLARRLRDRLRRDVDVPVRHHRASSSRAPGIWGVNIPVGWGFAIVNFVWWIGIGHAGTLISAILLLFRQKWRMSISRFAEAMTIFAVMCAAMFPVFHTGRPWLAAYWLFPYPNTMSLWPNFRSPLIWDVFAVSTYATVSVLFWYVGLIPDLATMRDRAQRCG